MRFLLRGRVLPFCLSLIVFFGAGCAGYTTRQATSQTPQVGTLSASVTALNFQNVTVGQSVTQTLQLTNTGTAPVQLTGLSTSSQAFTIKGPAIPQTIAVSSTLTYTVSFTPATSGTATAVLNIASNASNPVAAVSLSGAGITAASPTPTPAPTQHSVQLTWKPSSTAVIGYLVYRSETSGTSYNLLFGTAINQMAYEDTNVTAGTTYYYVVTAVAADGEQSVYSNEVKAVIP